MTKATNPTIAECIKELKPLFDKINKIYDECLEEIRANKHKDS